MGACFREWKGGCNGRWVRRKPDRMGQKGRAGNGESLKNLKQSNTVGGLCFVKTALMLSGEDIWRGKRQTQKTMQIWMRLVKVETEKCTSPRDAHSQTEGQGKGEEIWNNSQFCSFYKGRAVPFAQMGKAGHQDVPLDLFNALGLTCKVEIIPPA